MDGTTSLDRQKRAEKEASERGLTIVPPFDHKQIIIGQGTMGLEILEQCPDVGTVFVPVGGGGHGVRCGGRDQVVQAIGAHRRRRAGRRAEDVEVARGRSARSRCRRPRASPTA